MEAGYYNDKTGPIGPVESEMDLFIGPSDEHIAALPTVTMNGTRVSTELADMDLSYWRGDWRIQWKRVPSGLDGVST